MRRRYVNFNHFCVEMWREAQVPQVPSLFQGFLDWQTSHEPYLQALPAQIQENN
jgi:hypothetical protein